MMSGDKPVFQRGQILDDHDVCQPGIAAFQFAFCYVRSFSFHLFCSPFNNRVNNNRKVKGSLCKVNKAGSGVNNHVFGNGQSGGMMNMEFDHDFMDLCRFDFGVY